MQVKSWHNWKRYWNAIKSLWWTDICRFQPLGMFNWCYLQPRLPENRVLHRQLWWRTRNKLPVLFWLPLEIIRWLNWRLWLANNRVEHCLTKLGPDTMRRFGVTVDEQRQQLFYWAKIWGIDPSLAYEWGLFHANKDALNYILGGEVQPFHRLMNQQRGVTKADYRLLFDKSLLTGLMTTAGVPMAPVIGVSHGEANDLRAAIASSGPVFCKLQSGSRGESAFMAESGLSGLFGQTLAGKVLENEATVMAAWKTLSDKGSVLIQPYLRNHAMLQQLSPDTEAMTLRVITRAHDAGFGVWSGFLYVQAPGAAIDRWYWMMKIDAFTGQAFDAFGHWLESESVADDVPQLLMLGGQALPFWQVIVRHSERAHAELPRLWTIAWDWIITPDGPVLLEGNAGWDISPLQELGVDFVKIGCEMTQKSLKQ